MNKQAVLSLSGGMDSSTLLLHLLANDYEVTALSFDYGQKHKVELERAVELEKYINEYFVVDEESKTFDYPFKVCKVDKIIAPIVATNEKSIKLVTNMGFTEEARIKRSNGDMVFFTMLKENCRFLGDKYEVSTDSTTSTRLCSSS